VLTYVVRSETEITLISLLTGLAGRAPREPGNGKIHYSVHILRHLGIAEYTRVPLLSDATSLSAVIPKDNENKFEAEILETYVKHILCAHVNIKQARNTAETITSSDPQYNQRLSEQLRPNASYQTSDIPLCAILSAFNRLNQEGESGSLDKIVEQMKKQSQEPKARKPIGMFHRNPTATVTFEYVSSSDAPDVPLELRRDNSGQPLLVFTRTFRLLMGRPFENTQK
jgi:hypothetical protein